MGTERERYAGGEEQMAAQEGRRSSALPAIPLKEGAPMGGQSSGRTRQWLTRRADDHPLEPSHSPEPSLVHPSSDRTARHSTQSSSSTPHHSSALASPLQASSRQSSSRGVSTHESHAYSSGQHLPPSSYDALTPSQRIAHESQTERAPDPSARSGNFFGIGGLPSGAGHHSRREDDRVPPPPSKSSPRRDPPPTSSSRRPPAPPATPPPKRSFFGLGGKIPSPKPPSSNSKPSPSTLQKPRAPPTSHGRSSSGGEIGRTLSSTPVRSSATAAYRTSQSVGRTTTRPDRDAEDWVVLDPPERAPLPPPHQRLSESPQRSQEPYNHGFRTPLRRARELSTEFASPPFFATSPPTSDSHGSYEGGADLLGMGSLGDARDWRWKEILEGYQGPRGGTPVHSREGTEESGRAEVVARPARRSSLLPVQTGVERMEYAMSPPGRASNGFVSPERVVDRRESSMAARREVMPTYAEFDGSASHTPQQILSTSSSYSTLTGATPTHASQPPSSATYSPVSTFLGNSPNSSLHATPPRPTQLTSSSSMSPIQQSILHRNSLVAGHHGRVAPTHPAAVRRPLDSDSDKSSIRPSLPPARVAGFVPPSPSSRQEEELDAPLSIPTSDAVPPAQSDPFFSSPYPTTEPAFSHHPIELPTPPSTIETSVESRSSSPFTPSSIESLRPSGEQESAGTPPSSVDAAADLAPQETRSIPVLRPTVEEQPPSRSSRPSSSLANDDRLPSSAGMGLSSPILLDDASVVVETAELEAIAIEEDQPRPRFEFALVIYTDAILANLLHHLSYQDYRSLRAVSKTMLRCIEGDAKELVLQRFLGPFGYRTLPTTHFSTHKSHHPSHNLPLQRSTSSSIREDTVVLDLRDLDAFQIGMEYTVLEYALFAREHAKEPLGLNTLRMIRASTRAFNRIVIRIRAQHVGPLARLSRPPYAFSRLAALAPVYKSGRAALLRVWVPAKKSWLSDSEVVETEREVWRSGVWTHLKRGDIVHDVAVGDFGNEGKLIYDGKYLRDFQFSYDLVGHLPPWLDMVAFPPGYYHNIVASSTPNPVFYLGLNLYVDQIRESLALCDEKVQVSSPQGSYQIKRFVYRGSCRINAGAIIGGTGGAGGAGPGGVDIVHEDWSGTVVVETDGTTEHATTLIARCSSTVPTPWRILRDKSRPGKLWLRPVLDDERTS